MEEVSSRLLLFQLGQSYRCHTAQSVEFGPEMSRKDKEDFQSAHVCLCQISFLCRVSLKIINKGKSFYYSSVSEGRLKKSLDDPAEGVIRSVSTLYVWRRVDPPRCQK